PETPSAMPHAAPLHRSMPLPALPHSALPSAAAPAGCCTSRLPPPSGTETTAAAARTTASASLYPHTSSVQDAVRRPDASTSQSIHCGAVSVHGEGDRRERLEALQ